MTMEQANQYIKDAWSHALRKDKSIPDDIAKTYASWVKNRTNQALANAAAKASASASATDGADAQQSAPAQ